MNVTTTPPTTTTTTAQHDSSAKLWRREASVDEAASLGMQARATAQVASAAKPGKRKRAWLIPREHGAYAQLLLPLVVALLVGGATAPAGVAFAAAFVAAFVSTEALRTLLGHRGKRKQQQLRGLAHKWLASSAALALLLGGLGAVLAPQAALVALAVPAGLGALGLVLLWLGREKSVFGEMVVASALTSCALPVALAGGVALLDAVLMLVAFALGFAFATVAVHLVVRHKKRPVAVVVRLAVGAAALGVVVAGIVGAVAWTYPFAAAASVATLPLLGTVTVLAVRLPHPRKLREIGWTLAGMTTLMALLLIVGYFYYVA